jgi:hypothetical protein
VSNTVADETEATECERAAPVSERAAALAVGAWPGRSPLLAGQLGRRRAGRKALCNGPRASEVVGFARRGNLSHAMAYWPAA